MCGIVGVGSTQPLHNRHWLALGRDAMVHRGPDDFGEWWSSDGRVGLAQRRLSIVELSSAGHQPMLNVFGSLSIIFNGEIYNHGDLRNELTGKGYLFRSHSDTEVILAAYQQWGEACLTHFNGVFAFVIFDAKRSLLFMARDRAGEKPFFYYHATGEIRFASELKALLADVKLPRKIKPESLDCYLAMGYVPGERCLLQGFNKLPPAHALIFDLNSGHSKIWQYWQLPEFSVDTNPLSSTSLLDEFESLLEDAVRMQMLADVPVGILLSGGVDSSLITAMALRTSSQVQTFTIGFPGYGNLDETEHARLISRHFGTRHIELMAHSVTADVMPKLAHQFDEPIADSSIIPTFLVSQLVRQHCAVALGGDGGDELFGGYEHYSRLMRIKGALRVVPSFVNREIAHSAEKFLPVGFKGRNWMRGLDVNIDNGVQMVSSYFDFTTRGRLMRAHPGWPLIAESLMQDRIPVNSDLLQRSMRMDFSNYLAEDILVKIDRASMLSSLEMRAPFLDYRLVEFAFGKVPTSLKASKQEKKILLKKLAARILPPEFDRQRKQGLSIPLGSWLKIGTFNNLFNEVLRDPQCSFDAKTIDHLLRGQEMGRSNGERLFALVLFELWRQDYGVRF